MGYFQHKHASIRDAGIIKICKHCGNEFEMISSNQKYCSRGDNPECYNDRYYQMLWEKGKHPLQGNDRNWYENKTLDELIKILGA